MGETAMGESDQTATIQALSIALKDPKSSLATKYRILFALRNLKEEEAHFALAEGLHDKSDLFRHEVAYCLGQRCDPIAISLLADLMDSVSAHPMVRHEAGEALGAIGTPECLAILEQHQQDRCREVAQTCQLAMQRIAFLNSKEGAAYREESRYLSVDPAPAYPSDTPVGELQAMLLNDQEDIFKRYRAMFALRNIGTDEALQALGRAFSSDSALLKHEVAYVLGQMQNKDAVAALRKVLRDDKEDAMVRHEAAEALGAIADPECLDLLHEYSSHQDPIVADSCIVALDMLNHEKLNEWQYALTSIKA